MKVYLPEIASASDSPLVVLWQTPLSRILRAGILRGRFATPLRTGKESGLSVSGCQCQHNERIVAGRACCHLLDSGDSGYLKRFTGTGRRYDLICSECGQSPNEIEATLRSVCAECLGRIEVDGDWEGIIGSPEISCRASRLRFEHETIRIPELAGIQIHELQPVDEVANHWIVVTAEGTLLDIDLTERLVRPCAEISLGFIEFHEKILLRVSSHGEMAAVANTHGRHGVVIDLASGTHTMRLLRDDYHSDVSAFPVAFTYQESRLLLVHATAWNRLDISNPWDGRLLTERAPTSYKNDAARPEHYLDYFHGGLTTSPDHKYLADTGWVWAPIGVIATWSIERWLDGNAWESEDGPSKRYLCQREYFWDGPLCWLNGRELAIWGYGQDDECMIPAVRIFDVPTGEQVRWFPGPNGNLVFDGHLFSSSAEEGTTVWDIASGERLLAEPMLAPIGYHAGSKAFLSLLDNGEVLLSRLEEDASSDEHV